MLGSDAIVEKFRSLSIEEKLALLHTLWDEVASEATAAPLSEAQRVFLDERLRETEADGDDVDWATLRNELLR